MLLSPYSTANNTGIEIWRIRCCVVDGGLTVTAYDTQGQNVKAGMQVVKLF
jgi:hypothetical protein